MDTNPTSEEPERLWERGWDGHELEQLRRMAHLSFAEKLAWLEEAHRLVKHLKRVRKGLPPTEPTEGGSNDNA